MNKNIFFKKIKKISVNEICKKLKIKNIKKKKNYLNDIKTLDDASRNDLTFLHSSKYIKLIPKIKFNGVKSIAAIPILMAGILLRIG